MIPIVIYSHSDYSDLWLPVFDRLNQFMKYDEGYLLSDDALDFNLNKYNFKHVSYTDTLSYNKRLEEALSKIDAEYIIFFHEDMILYDYVNDIVLSDYISFIKTNSEYDYIRLLKSGIASDNKIHDTLYTLTQGDFNFSVIPTIWRKNVLHRIAQETTPVNLWDFEINGNSYVKDNNIKGLYSYNGEPKRGGHFDSSVFPHICTAIFKGKWNMAEYPNEINKISVDYNIDINHRGFFNKL